MSILTVPSSMPYPPGFTGDPYTPNDISVFFDLNWPDHAGILGEGYSAPGLGCPPGADCGRPRLMPRFHGFMGLGQDDSGDDTEITTTYTEPTGGGTTPITVPDVSCDSVPLSSMTAQQMSNCGYTVSTGGSVTLTPQAAGLTPAQTAQLIAATGNSAVSLIRTAAGGPYQVAGTNLIYNPATGQLTTSTAVNASASLTAGLASIGPYVPLIIGAIAAIIILPNLIGGKR